MRVDDATTTDDKQEGDLFRMQLVPTVQLGGARTSYCGIACFTVCVLVFGGAAIGGVGDDGGLRSSRIKTRTAILAATTAASFVLWHRGSGSPQGNPPDVPRSTAEDHGEHAVKKLQATVQTGKTTRK